MPVNALVPVPTFEVLLGRLEDKDVVKLPERIHLAALASLELSKEVTGDLEQEGTRKEIVERFYIEHGKPPAGMPQDAHRIVQGTPQPAQAAPPPAQPPMPGSGSASSGSASSGAMDTSNMPRRGDSMPVTTGPPGPPGPPGAPGVTNVVHVPMPYPVPIVNPIVQQIESHLANESSRAHEARLHTMEAEVARIRDGQRVAESIQKTAAEVLARATPTHTITNILHNHMIDARTAIDARSVNIQQNVDARTVANIT